MPHHLTRHVLEFPPPVRHPLVQVLGLGALIQGLGLLIGGPAPGTTAESLSPHLLTVWAVGLTATGVGFMTAALWRDVVTGVLIEAATCVIAALSVGAYVAAAIAALGATDSPILPVLLPGAYGVGCIIRVGQIVWQLHRATSILRARPGSTGEGEP